MPVTSIFIIRVHRHAHHGHMTLFLLRASGPRSLIIVLPHQAFTPVTAVRYKRADVWERILCSLPLPPQLHTHSLSGHSHPVSFSLNTFESLCQRFHPHQLSFRMKPANRNGITHHLRCKNTSILKHPSIVIRILYWYNPFISCSAISFERVFSPATCHLLL